MKERRKKRWGKGGRKERTPCIFIKHNLPSDFTISLRLLFILTTTSHLSRRSQSYHNLLIPLSPANVYNELSNLVASIATQPKSFLFSLPPCFRLTVSCKNYYEWSPRQSTLHLKLPNHNLILLSSHWTLSKTVFNLLNHSGPHGWTPRLSILPHLRFEPDFPLLSCWRLLLFLLISQTGLCAFY